MFVGFKRTSLSRQCVNGVSKKSLLELRNRCRKKILQEFKQFLLTHLTLQATMREGSNISATAAAEAAATTTTATTATATTATATAPTTKTET